MALPIKKIDEIDIFNGWFRILEISLIIGAIKYIADIKDNILLRIVFWISWFFFYQYIISVFSTINFDLLPEKYKDLQNKFNIVISHILAIVIIFLMYVVIINVIK